MPATFNFFPFDNQASYETQWREMAQTWRTTGIIVQGTSMDTSTGECAVSPGTGLQIKISVGRAWIKGHMFVHTDDYEFLPISPNSGGATRTDLVVIRADFTANTIGYQILEGTTTPVQTTTIWDLPLAAVAVEDGATSIDVGDITDLRVSSNQASFAPICVVRNGTNQMIANSSSATLTWDTEDLDPMGMHSLADPNVIVIKEKGVYEVKCSTVWADTGTSDGARRIIIWLSRTEDEDTGIAYGSALGTTSNVDVGVSASRIIELQPSDYLYVIAYNNSGASVDIKSSGLYSPIFSVVKIAESTGI